VLTYREDKEGEFLHFSLFRNRNWGFVVYDEVHMLPAPVFRITSEIQSLSRMGLTATLIREDGKEGEVFSLVGPKRYDTPWSELEKAGFIATAVCHEIRVDMPDEMEIEYALATKRDKYRLASENSKKIPVVRKLLQNHEDDHILIIGQYIDQLKELQKEFGFPIITGTTANSKRDKLYQAFRNGEIKVLIVSKVANFAIDLPDASVAIQVSGSFGSRQEEAQRLGRILRPKQRESHFYSIITRYSVEEEFAQNRQKFLSEQGYAYIAENSEDI
jgi:DNA or RNA helicases of superfamily II